MRNEKGRSVFIVGNGPSVAAIDYRRLPRDIEVWRVNQFWNEAKYYAGRKIDKYFCGNTLNSFIYNYFFTIYVAASKGEYDALAPGEFLASVGKNPRPPFHDPVDRVYRFAQEHNLGKLTEFEKQCLRLNKFPQTGSFMIAFAAVLGYTRIYIAGVDADYSKQHYFYDVSLSPEGVEELRFWHDPKLDMKFIVLIASEFSDSALFSVSPSSPISYHIELAPIINEYPEGYTPPDKPEGYVKDIVKINMLDPPASSLEVRYEQLVKSVNDRNNEMSNNIGRLRESLNGVANKIDA
ncbi:MAG: hypothetical protein LBP89_04410 [Helicobacteraceae bacterium]|jgi:hypothetical protein|nr:hypothetical protein [Helicobacteraceae bacterium]